MLQAFTATDPGVKLFLGEYAFSNLNPNLNLTSVAEYYYSQAIMAQQNGSGARMGLAAWNFDGPAAWGALVPHPAPWDNRTHFPTANWAMVNARFAGKGGTVRSHPTTKKKSTATTRTLQAKR